MRQLFKVGSISWSLGPHLFGTGSNCATHANNIADLVCNKIATDYMFVPFLTFGMVAPQDLLFPPVSENVNQIPSTNFGPPNCQITDSEMFTIKYSEIFHHHRRSVVSVSAGSLTVTASGNVRGCVGLVWIVVHYTLLYIIGGMWGPLSDFVLMGPPPQCSGFNWLFHVDCNLFFGDNSPSPCTSPGLCCTVRWGNDTFIIEEISQHRHIKTNWSVPRPVPHFPSPRFHRILAVVPTGHGWEPRRG